uniref:3-hydroxyacyl-CoA dehydrogenase n=1 Tax=Hordeum vulgare subsp. vulgare TaxID=112509 RepID=A0A8I7B0M5_HORVV
MLCRLTICITKHNYVISLSLFLVPCHAIGYELLIRRTTIMVLYFIRCVWHLSYISGTQRLPRLVGLTKALEMMMLSKPIKAEEAHELGLVDAVVSPNNLLNDARRWALDICESKRPWVRSLYKTDRLESPELAREILNSARVQSRKRAANLQYPFVCIDAVEEGIVSGPRAGLRKEAMAFQELFFSDTCKSLIHVFFSQRAASMVPGITDLGLMPRKVSKVAIVGGGLMGSGIATALILSHYPVILKEVDEKFLNTGIDRIKENLQSRVRKAKMTNEKYEKTLSLLTGVLDYDKFRSVDLAIEAAVENVKLKQQFFAELEQHCPSHCILATNTSTIDFNLIGEKTNSQDRIVGTHFFAPAHIMPLLEIVRTPHASLQAVVTLLDVGKKIKKIPIVVGNCTGFAVNRMFFPYTQAALLLVDHGMDVYKIDQACTEFGMPIGPFRMTDLVGFGVALATGMQYLENFPERVYKSMLIPLMIEDKRTGEASQKGFYRYEGKRKASPDLEIMNYVEESRRIAGATPDPELLKLDNNAIAEMVFFPVINEACHVLDEGITFKAFDLDIASIFSMGFPPYRGGIMHWADSIGARCICTMLSEWEMKYGQFFKPCSC